MNDRDELTLQTSATTRRQILLGSAAAVSVVAMSTINASAADESGLTQSTEAIHQEPVFQAARKRVYEALTEANEFEKIVQLSAAKQSGAIGPQPAEISSQAGGAFTLFGGYIVGRHIELVPNERIVQAWRAQSWKPGVYSIVQFELVEQGRSTKIVFDHKGFPEGQGQHLAAGWKANYWEPMQKYLSGQK